MNSEFLVEFSEIFNVSANEMESSFKFVADEHWDSLAVVSTIALIDQYFNVAVKADDFMKCQSYNELCEVIRNKANV